MPGDSHFIVAPDAILEAIDPYNEYGESNWDCVWYSVGLDDTDGWFTADYRPRWTYLLPVVAGEGVSPN